MLGDPDNETLSERIWNLLSEEFWLLAPIWIVRRPETLTITDYRPTLFMFLSGAGFLFFFVAFVVYLIKVPIEIDSFGLWSFGTITLVLLILTLRGTIREAYYFNNETDSYAFVRQFIYRKEVIEGALSQFTGARVKTVTGDESESYFVVLDQEGMFLTGVNEQLLREQAPILNLYSTEERIADAISDFLPPKR